MLPYNLKNTLYDYIRPFNALHEMQHKLLPFFRRIYSQTLSENPSTQVSCVYHLQVIPWEFQDTRESIIHAVGDLRKKFM